MEPTTAPPLLQPAPGSKTAAQHQRAESLKALLMAPIITGPQVLNKYGFRTETTGSIKVRVHTMIQHKPEPELERPGSACSGEDIHRPDQDMSRPPHSPLMSPHGKRVANAKLSKKVLSLQAIVDRARNRLRDARGGDDVVVRPGVVSEAPSIRQHPPELLHVQEGNIAELKIIAKVSTDWIA